ncbi:M20/M25/M40 family metallo-hydrolase [Massilia sp. W12]|uniref:M20/M25/M40 family metallo-hydrolase n=1 Tax=Massilia sp. W12 TaxID=3126507 RepID=UPI0030CC2A3B
MSEFKPTPSSADTVPGDADSVVSWPLAMILLSLTAICCAALLAALTPHFDPTPPGPGVFDVQRAQASLEQIARAPHPIGSAEHGRVREYLIKSLQDLGMAVEVQEGVGHSAWSSGRVKNIISRIPGSRPGGKAVLLMAHYDTAPHAPGAADNGMAVAAVLETLRQLRQEPPLLHDLIVLFSDGEEAGMLGAQLFASEHPARDAVGLVLNFEMRGAGGPLLMFETQSGSAPQIRTLAQALPQIQANSLFYEVYRLMPNYTDFSVFKNQGVAGLNFAAIEDHTRYHSRTDTLQNIDPATLQQLGQSMLAAVRAFGQQEKQQSHGGELVYFHLPVWGMAYYPPSWLPFFVCAGLLLWQVRSARREQHLRLWKTLASLPVQLVWLGLAAGSAWLLWRLQLWMDGDYRISAHGGMPQQLWHLLAMQLAALTVCAAMLQGCLRLFSLHEWRLGAALLWLFLLGLSLWRAPGMSYLLLGPLALALLGGLLQSMAYWRRPAPAACLWSGLLILALCLHAPLWRLVAQALTPAMAWVCALLLALLLALFAPWLAAIRPPVSGKPWPLTAALSAALFLACGAAGLLTPQYSPHYPRPSHLAWLYDAENEESWWFSRDPQPDHYTRFFFPQQARLRPLPVLGDERSLLWLHPAPGRLAPPQIEVLSDRILQRRGAVRAIELKIRPARADAQLKLQCKGRLLAVHVEGRRMDKFEDGPWIWLAHGFGEQGLHLQFELESGLRLHCGVLERSFDLDPSAQAPLQPDIMPRPFSDAFSRQVYVAKEF